VRSDGLTESAPVGVKGVWSFTWKYRGDRKAGTALHNIVDLAEHGLLERIRRCTFEDCALWFTPGGSIKSAVVPGAARKSIGPPKKAN